jgi:hypothetical protein
LAKWEPQKRKRGAERMPGSFTLSYGAGVLACCALATSERWLLIIFNPYGGEIMRNTIKTSVLAITFLALASVGAFADANQTSTTIGLSATVSSFDNITCTQTTVDLNGGSAITASGLTPAQPVACSVTTNDTSTMSVTAYIPTGTLLTGVTTSNTIANTAIQWSATSGGTFAAFAPLTGLGDGAVVKSSVAVGDATPVSFYLQLAVPAGQHADTYSATMTVAITPHV